MFENQFELIKASFNDGRSIRYGYRLWYLQKLQQLLLENREALVEAIGKDVDGKQSNEEIELLNIIAPMSALYKEYKILEKLYKKQRLPNQVDAGINRVSTALIIGNHMEPLGSLFVPLLYAIATGTAATLKCPEESRNLKELLTRLFGQYFDREMYVISEASVDELLRLPYGRIICTGRDETEAPHVLYRDAGINVVAMVEEDQDVVKICQAISKLKFGGGFTLASPDAFIIPGSMIGDVSEELRRSCPQIKVRQSKALPSAKHSDLTLDIVPVSSTEVALAMVNSSKINRFTFFGNTEVGDYFLEFSPAVKTAFINTVELFSYKDVSTKTFTNERTLVRNKKIIVSEKLTWKALPKLIVKYPQPIGFFEQGFLFGATMFLAGLLGASISAVWYVKFRG